MAQGERAVGLMAILTPDDARDRLRDATVLRYCRTDLVDAFTRRAVARHNARQDIEETVHNLVTAQLLAIADLPDEDLQWLLDQGWKPGWATRDWLKQEVTR